MKINLAAGEDRRDGWVSVDLRDDVADVVADVRRLPFPDGSVDAIMALDCLEHFPADQSRALLAEWHRVLVPGGALLVKVPNMYELARCIVAFEDVGNRAVVTALIRNTYGGHRWGPEGAWDAHHTGWTPSMLLDLLDEAGFDLVTSDGELNMSFEVKKR